MTLTLTARDLSRLTRLQEVLLSPLEYGSVPEWCLACLRGVEKLAEADRSVIMMPLRGETHYMSESVPPEYLAAFQDRITDYGSGSIRFNDEAIDQAWSARNLRGRRIWNERVLASYLGARLEDLPIYHELIKPAGYGNGAVASVPLFDGEAFLGFSYSSGSEERLTDAEAFDLMELVVPALQAGVKTLSRLEAHRNNLARAVDDLAEALAIFGPGSKELHRSVRLRQLLEADPEREKVVQRIRELARSVLRFRLVARPEEPDSRVLEEIETAIARYEIRATRVGRGCLALEDAVLISVERLTPQLPSKQSLADQFELTPRQAEVALLLARGLSDQEIGERLGISHHTARHHAEWVFTKLGIHSRKAVGLKLLGYDLET